MCSVDEQVRDELWAAGAAVAQGDALCLLTENEEMQRTLNPSLCKPTVLVITEAFTQ